MTVRETVVDFLKSQFPGTYTNSQLANALAIPEPSVRRATSQLERLGRIYFEGTGSGQRLMWRAISATE